MRKSKFKLQQIDILRKRTLGTQDIAGRWPATSWVHYTTSCNTQSSAPEDGRDQRPKHVELIGIINKPLLLHLVGVYIIYSIVNFVSVLDGKM